MRITNKETLGQVPDEPTPDQARSPIPLTGLHKIREITEEVSERIILIYGKGTLTVTLKIQELLPLVKVIRPVP